MRRFKFLRLDRKSFPEKAAFKNFTEKILTFPIYSIKLTNNEIGAHAPTFDSVGRGAYSI